MPIHDSTIQDSAPDSLTPPTADPDKPGIFHGWKVVGGGAIMQGLQAGLFLNSYGNYAVILEEQFGWSKTMLSSVFSFSRFESAMMGPAQGWALDRFGTRPIMRTGIVIMTLGFLGFSQIQNALQFFLAIAVIAFGAALSGFLSVTTAVVRWFERKRARALSISSIGFALGGMIGPGVVFVLERIGWRWTVGLAGAVVGVIGWATTSVFGGTPADRGEHVDGVPPQDVATEAPRAEGVSDVHLTANQALRTRAFWMISFGHASALLVVSASMAHLSLYLTTEQDFSLQKASIVGGVLPVFQMFGMLIGGQLGDRVNKRLMASVAMIGHMVGLLMLTFATNDVMVWSFVPLHGLAWGIRGPMMQAIRADYFGSTYFGQIMGFSALIVMLGSVGGPLLAGILADTTGSYRLGFTIISIIAGLGLFFFVLATPPKPVHPANQPQDF